MQSNAVRQEQQRRVHEESAQLRNGQDILGQGQRMADRYGPHIEREARTAQANLDRVEGRLGGIVDATAGAFNALDTALAAPGEAAAVDRLLAELQAHIDLDNRDREFEAERRRRGY